MSVNRPSLGFDDGADEQSKQKSKDFDLTGFKPKAAIRPDADAVAKAAAETNFKSREPESGRTLQAPQRNIRRRRTGRSAQLNLKVRPDTVEQFYALADANGWGLGEAFEIAVELLEKHHSSE